MTAQRRYIVVSTIVVIAYAALMLIVTFKISEAPQLGMGQILVPALLWAFLIWMIWALRKGYLGLDNATVERYNLK